MKFRHSAIALLVGVLTLNGCTTDLWERNSPFQQTTTEKPLPKTIFTHLAWLPKTIRNWKQAAWS